MQLSWNREKENCQNDEKRRYKRYKQINRYVYLYNIYVYVTRYYTTRENEEKCVEKIEIHNLPVAVRDFDSFCLRQMSPTIIEEAVTNS